MAQSMRQIERVPRNSVLFKDLPEEDRVQRNSIIDELRDECVKKRIERVPMNSFLFKDLPEEDRVQRNFLLEECEDMEDFIKKYTRPKVPYTYNSNLSASVRRI